MGNLEPFLNHFGTVFRHLEQFFGHLEDIFEVSVFRKPHGLKNGPKTPGRSDFSFLRNRFFLLIFGFTFRPLFDQVLDHLWVSLWVSLGSLLGPLEVLLGGLWIQKHEKTHGFLRFLAMRLFGFLKLLMVIMGSSRYLFRCFGPKVGPIMVLNRGLEID